MTIPTERVDFESRGTRCAAWLTLPAGAGPHPAVVLVHGLGATHDMMLAQYEPVSYTHLTLPTNREV